jgi:type II secretory pathway pseudopilin PulG
MTNAIPIRRRPRPSEEGYILVMVVFMIAILVLTLSVAGPVVRKQIQRDRDVETMRRGKQYVRAVRMYYKKFGAYPPSIDALLNTNQVRFLRKKYIDPTSGKDEWKIIRVGQNKTQTLGFFGQPIGGSTIAGTGPGAGGPNPSAGMTTSPGGIGSTGSAFGSTTDTGTTPTLPGATTGTSTDGSTAAGVTATGSTDPNAPGGTSASGTGTGLTGQTFGGGGMIGVSPTSAKQSILVYKKKNHYNEWEFFYDPIAEQMMMQGGNAGAIGQPASTTTVPVGGSGIGSGSGIDGSSGTTTTNPGTSNPGTTAPTLPTAPPQ